MQVKQVYVAYDRRGSRDDGRFKYCPFCTALLVMQESGEVPRPTCPSCGFVQFRNPSPAVSILVVDGGRLLLGRRTGAPGAGKWALPSGYIEYEDDFLSAAIREVTEETGLDVEICSIVNVVSSFFSSNYHFLGIYLLACVIGGDLKAGDDLDAVEWFPLSGPWPEMAFQEDTDIVAWYAAAKPQGLPVDPRFSFYDRREHAG